MFQTYSSSYKKIIVVKNILSARFHMVELQAPMLKLYSEEKFKVLLKPSIFNVIIYR